MIAGDNGNDNLENPLSNTQTCCVVSGCSVTWNNRLLFTALPQVPHYTQPPRKRECISWRK